MTHAVCQTQIGNFRMFVGCEGGAASIPDHPPHHETVRPVEQHGTFWILFIHFSYLVGYDFFFTFFIHLCVILDCFLFFAQIQSVLLVGITAGTVEPLPHVKKYQAVAPQRLEDPSPINAAAAARQVSHKRLLIKTLELFEKWTEVESSPCVSEQTFPDVLQYFLTITEQNYTLHLEKNK